MDGCMYCGNNNPETMFSLEDWKIGGYCSRECLSEDIKRHEDFIGMYKEGVDSARSEILVNEVAVIPLSKEEENELVDKLTIYKKRQKVLLEKLSYMEDLVETGRLKYSE